MDSLLKKIEIRQIYLLSGGVIFLLLTAFGLVIGKPLAARYSAAQWEMQTLVELGQGHQSIEITPLEQSVRRNRAALLGELQNVPLRELESHIIGALQNSAWQAEVELVSVEPQDTSEGLPYEEVAFRLELRGRYASLDDWIRRVSEHLGYVVFKEYAIKVEQESADPLLSARILLAAYRVEDGV